MFGLGHKPRIIPTGNAQANAANVILKYVKHFLGENDIVVLGFVGGNSVKGVYQHLNGCTNLEWGRVHVFLGDERWVSPDHGDSNYRLISHYLGNLVKKGLRIYPFYPGKLGDYKKLFEQVTKDHGKKCDLILLSSGEDGHVASLFPNHSSIKNGSREYIEVKAPNYIDGPKHRVSMSRKMILDSKVALLLFIGEKKMLAYNIFINGDDYISCPARLVKKIEHSYVFTNIK